jgi:hypothetical protein
MEFGFYDLLLDAVPELEGYKRKYTVIYPRFQKVIELNPSRRATTEKRIKDIFDTIENDSFKPACGIDVDTMQLSYKYGYCTICTLEEIAAYNGINQYLPS